MNRISVLLAALVLVSPAISNSAPPAAVQTTAASSLVAVPVAIWSNGQVFVRWMWVPAQAMASMPAVSGSAMALPAATTAAATTMAASVPAAAVSAPSAAVVAAVNVAGKITGSTATHARSITATCYSCHGTDGKSHSAIPALAGLEVDYFVEQMKDFKSGKREATVMHQHAKGYTDEEFLQMAKMFAAIKP